MISDVVRISGFSPRQISGLAVWYDCMDRSTIFTGTFANRLTSTTIASDGDLVCRIQDKSGNGRHSTCVSDGDRGALSSSGINNKRCLTLGSYNSFINSTNPCTWYVVHKGNGTLVDTRLVSNQAVNGIRLGYSSFSAWNLSFVREGIAWTNSGFSPGTTSRLYRVVFSGGVSTFHTLETGTATLRQSIALSGSVGSFGEVNLPGFLGEMILFQKNLTTFEDSLVTQYLRMKWGF